jgi:imidazolonepropionase-like amidohydrolase
VITTISLPVADNVLVSGLSVAVRTAGTSVLDDASSIIKGRVGLHVTIGIDSVSDTLSTVSSQVAALRNILLTALKPEEKSAQTENHFADVVQGKIPLIVHTESKANIAVAIKLRNELRWHHKRAGGAGEGMRLVIYGGAESHLLAAELADHNVPVVLKPARCQPATWSMRQCLAGQPLTRYTTAQVLHKAGVAVSLSSEDIGAVRQLLWETGFQHQRDTGLINAVDAIGMVTWQVADAFQLPASSGRISEGESADFVALDANPLQFGSHITLVSSAGLGVVCHPQQA